MVVLCIPVLSLDRSIEVPVRFLELLLVLMHVGQVKIVVSVTRVDHDCLLVHIHRLFVLTQVIEGESKILVVERVVFLAASVTRCFDLLPLLFDCHIIACQRILILSRLELRQAEVVVETGLSAGMLHGMLKGGNRLLE